MRRRHFFGRVGSAAVGGVALVGVSGLASAAPVAQGTSPLSLPVVGTFPGGGTFTGTFELERFEVEDGQLVAVGTLSGTLKNALGAIVGVVTDLLVTLPVGAVTGTCDILHLELGPLDLDLLGLKVHLDKIVLDIDAEEAPGNLLGNLLCAITHLLDSNAATMALANILNHILRLLS